MPISRRSFVQSCALAAMSLASAPVLGCHSLAGKKLSRQSGAATRTFSLDQGWLFGGEMDPAGILPSGDTAFSQVTLPHCVAKLSWQNWEVSDWQKVWSYRKRFGLPEYLRGLRVFLQFDGVMVGAAPVMNGHALPEHLGGYLPFEYEITDHLSGGGNVLDLKVDSRWLNVPPQGSPVGARRVDYLEPGGIHRSVRLKAVPQIFIRDVFAKPANVLDAERRLDVSCSIDAATIVGKPIQLQAELRDGNRVISRAKELLTLEKPGRTEVKLTLSNLGNVVLWDIDSPKLYHVLVTLMIDGKPVHDYRVRTGLRDARFELNGFFLNGRRVQLFGLNRHEVFPYVGYAMPERVMRRDAEILRREFNCNIVRCSHYPQSPAFLDACDELGLMVWEEVPGWGYIGDDTWKDLLVRDAHDMIVRDRNRPSIVIWGTRANESANDVDLYRRTKAVAKSLDDSRPTSGSMTPGSKKDWERNWHEDVFAFDDYHADADGSVGIASPVPGVPYMLAETVGQFNYTQRKKFDIKYRRAGDAKLQELQAVRHAQAHSKAARNRRNCGVIAWCAFDYSSLVNPYNNVKCPGVADSFRIPKPGAAFYLAQTDPNVRPVIEPAFYWDFGPQTPRGPGKQTAIFSNCDRLELFINGQHHASLRPDAKNYPHLKHPPFFADLEIVGKDHPELRIDGYIRNKLALTKSFSSDPSKDQLFLKADDTELIGDGADATRLVFRVVDRFGAQRPFVTGNVSFEITGPGTIVGDNPFALADSGGVGAVWIKANRAGAGRIIIKARHAAFGEKSVRIKVRRETEKATI